MKRVLYVSLFLAIFTNLFSLQQKRTGWDVPQVSKLRGTGGPDAYGYRWIDNDTIGGPQFNWIDIRGIGVRVQGLADDNVVGPFPIGFEFPYYWYRVNRFWINSNGVISFSSNVMWTSHQGGSLIPSPSLPNDVVAPLGGDLNPALGRGEVWYYTNYQDTLIVSFIDMPEWHYGTDTLGSHTFQLILLKQDSSIIFQYGPQRGTFNYGHPQAPPSNAIGIENVTGTIGLQYLRDNQPSYNMYHDSLAIKFYPPDTTSYQVIDLTMIDAGNEDNLGFFLLPQTPYVPWVRIKNTGNQPVSSFTTTFRIRTITGAVVYNQTQTGGPLNPQEVVRINFPTWTPTAPGRFFIESWVRATGDVVYFNDSSKVELTVLGGSTRLDYIHDTLVYGSTHWFGAGGGFGARFVPPAYPCVIETVYVGLNVASGSTPGNAILILYDDDGPGGFPGTVLAQDTFYVSNTLPMWYSLVPPYPITIYSGGFYVGYIQLGVNGPDFVVSNAPPFSRNFLEYTGAWAFYRDRDYADPWIRVKVQLPSQYTPLDSLRDIHAGNAILTVTNIGAVGFWSSNQAIGRGFIYPRPTNINTLFYGSFAIGNSPLYVADAWYERTQFDDRDFRSVQGLFYFQPGPRFSYEGVSGVFNDMGHPQPKGVRVEHLAYAYEQPDYDDFVIHEYLITSDPPLNNAYVGYFMDFDIDAYGSNLAGIDTLRRLAYMYYPATSRYAGVVLLYPTTPRNLSVLHNPTYVYPYQGCPDSIQFKFLDGTYSFPQGTTPADWSVVVSAGPFNLSSTPQKVAFAVVGGTSLSHLLQNAQKAIEVYNNPYVYTEEKWQNACDLRVKPVSNIITKNLQILFEAPNPKENLEIQIYDITGRLVLSLNNIKISPPSTKINLDLSSLAGGIYFLKIKDNKGFLRPSLKIIKL